MRLSTFELARLVGFVSWLVVMPVVAVTNYVAIPLGTLGGAFSYGYGINDSGQVTGLSLTTDNAIRAFVHTGNTMTDLGTLGGPYISEGSGISDSGQVTGYASISGGAALHAFVYFGGTMTDLGAFGDRSSQGKGINNSGQITGWYELTTNYVSHAFLYSGGTMWDLGTLGGTYSGGRGINDRGQVTGDSSISGDAALHAFIYFDGTMTDLGTLGGTSSRGHAINDSGQVTGYASISGDAALHAFLYSGGTMSDLGTLGGTSSEGYGINNGGQVVGWSGIAPIVSEDHAFLYSGGTMFDLNALVIAGLGGAVLDRAYGINDRGQIVANGCRPNVTMCQTYRLDPIPGSGTSSAYARNYVQKAYVAYYGRPADPGGQSYWAGRMDAEGQSLNAIIGEFGNSDEFNRRYGGLGYRDLVTLIYQQALGRDPDQGGLDWYVAELEAGRRTLQTITLDVLNGATTEPDSTVVANKLAVAAYYTAKVVAGCPYGTEQDGVDVITIVTALPASVTGAKTAIDAGCGP